MARRPHNFFPITSWGQALFQGGLLAAIFLAPVIGGRFDLWAAALIFSCLCLSALGRMLMGAGRLFPAGLTLSSFPWALAALLLISALSYFTSFSRFATDGELIKLGAGALLFWLVLQSRTPAATAARPTPSKAKRGAKAKPSPPPRESSPRAVWEVTSIIFWLLVLGSLLSQDWNFFYALMEQKIVLFSLLLLALIFIFFRGRQNPKRLPLWETALAAGGVTALYGIYDWLFMRLVLKNTSWQTFSTFFNPNPLAGFWGLVLFLALGAGLWAFTRRKTQPRALIFPLALSLLFLLAQVTTNSKGAEFSIFLAGLIFVFLLIAGAAFSRGKKALLICLLLLVFLAAPVGLVLARPGLKAKAVANLSLANRSNMFRYLTWQGSLNMAKAYPVLGVGPGAFESGFGRYAIAGYTRRAHENYLEMAATAGFPGMLCFIWLLGAGLIGLGRAFRRAPGGEKFLAAGAFSAVLIMVFHSLLDYDWFILANQLYFFLAVALGLLVGLDNPPAPARAAFRPAKLLVAALLLLLAGKALTLGAAEKATDWAQQLLAREDTWEARNQLKLAVGLSAGYSKAPWLLSSLSPTEEGRALLKKAVALEPNYAPYWLALGRAQERAGQLTEAADSYAQAGALNPQYLRAWQTLAELQLHQGHYQEAIAAWQQILQIQAGPAGQYQAIEYEVKTEYAEAHYALGLAGLKGFVPGGETAASHFEQALKILADYHEYGKELERQRAAIGEGESGKAAELKLLQAKCYYRLGEYYQTAHQPTAATRSYAAAASLIPDIALSIRTEDQLWQK